MARSKKGSDNTTILVTGANSGLGYAICCRLIDEFLYTRPQDQTLHLLFSVRDTKKRDDTLKRLRAHAENTSHQTIGDTLGIVKLEVSRIKLEGVLVDLTQLLSVKALAERFLEEGQYFDAVIWNAGITGWLGQNWFKAVPDVLTGLIHNTTHPYFAKVDIGLLAKPQLPAKNDEKRRVNEPILGQVFLSNVFGHYMLSHWLSPLFDSKSRIIWIGSISASAHVLDINDIQGLRSDTVYEGSKRVTELLALTSELPSTRSYVENFLPGKGEKPKMYLTHPGVVSTSIAALPWLIAIAMEFVFHLARLCGSPWHVVNPYKGAISAAYCALAPAEQIEKQEKRDGKGKWGSAVGTTGDERVARTDTEGWGYCGKVGAVPKGSITTMKGKYKDHKPLTEDARIAFEDDGRKAWRELEQMRMEWEEVLGSVEPESEEESDTDE